jgi:hypothetical protein
MLHWLYLLLSIAALALALVTAKAWVLGLCLLASFGFFIAWALAWYQERIGGNQRDEMAMIDPLELRRLRELAEARRAQQAAQAPGPDAPPP